jgi:hypothetical protein
LLFNANQWSATMSMTISGQPLIPTGSVRAASGDDTLIAYEVETPTGRYRFVPLPNDCRYLLWNDRSDWQEVFDTLDAAIAAVDQVERSHRAKAVQ